MIYMVDATYPGTKLDEAVALFLEEIVTFDAPYRLEYRVRKSTIPIEHRLWAGSGRPRCA